MEIQDHDILVPMSAEEYANRKFDYDRTFMAEVQGYLDDGLMTQDELAPLADDIYLMPRRRHLPAIHEEAF